MAGWTLAISYLNTVANAYETALGTSPTHEFRTGLPPATCEDPDSGLLLATITSPSDWLTASSGGVKTLTGTWNSSDAINTGTIGHIRSKTSGGTCIGQGRVGVTGDTSVPVTVQTTAAVSGVPVRITSYTFTAAGT